MSLLNPRLATVRQLLTHLRDARSSESELLMKEVLEDCADRHQEDEAMRELDLVIDFLEGRQAKLEEA